MDRGGLRAGSVLGFVAAADVIEREVSLEFTIHGSPLTLGAKMGS